MGFHNLGTPTIGLFLWQFKAWGKLHCPNPSKSKTRQSHLFQMVWKDGFRHGGQNKVAIEIAYIPHVHVFEFLQDEQGDMQIVVEWYISKNLSPQQYVKTPIIKNHFGHTWYGFKTDKPFPLVIFSSSKVSHSCVF
jgi:hypothetical protein